MRYAAREAAETVAAVIEAGERDVHSVAMAAVVTGIETGLRAALLDPVRAEVVRDAIIDAVHRAPSADPRGEHHAAASAMGLLEVLG